MGAVLIGEVRALKARDESWREERVFIDRFSVRRDDEKGKRQER